MPRFTFAAIGATFFNALSAALASGGALAALQGSPSLVAFAGTVADGLGPVTGSHVLITLAALAGVSVQVVLVAAWRTYLRERDPLFLALGPTISLGSASLSAGTAVFFGNEGMIARNHQTQATAPVVAALQTSSDGMRDVAARARALSRQADDLQTIEDDSGGTCTDVTTTPGDGPRARLRARHAREFAALSQQLTATAQTMFDNALDIMTADAAAAEALYREALSLTRSAEMRAIVDQLAALREDVTLSFFDAQNNARYTCQTPDFAAAIADLEAGLAQALDMQLHDIRPADTAIGDGFTLLFTDLWAWITGQTPDLPAAGRATLIGTLLIEFAQVSMLIADFRQRRRAGQDSDRWDRFQATRNRLSRTKMAQTERILGVLDRLTLRTDGTLWLVVGEGGLSAAARETVDFFDLDTDRAWAKGYIRTGPLGRLMPDWVDTRRGLIEGDMFTLYRLPRGIDRWRRRARRDLGHARTRQRSRHGAGQPNTAE